MGAALLALAGWAVFEGGSAVHYDSGSLNIFRNAPRLAAPLALVPRAVSFADGTEAVLQVAKGFGISVAAEGLGKARFMTMSPDGRVFVPDMVDYNLSREGSIFILDDFDEREKVFRSRTAYLTGLRGPHNVAFYKDKEGKDWIYITLTEHLVRYSYHAGDLAPTEPMEVVYRFPNAQSPTADNIVWHLTRTVLFVDDTMFVSVGSGCNLCEEEEGDMRAMILAMNPDGTDARIYADGVKNAVGLEWTGGSLYATENGVDHLGNDDPDDLLYKIEEGRHYGWPYCFEAGGEKYRDNSRAWTREPVDCSSVPVSFAGFDPHSAPLGVTYFGTNAHAALKDSFLVAMQGSWQPEVGKGYEVLRVSKEGEIDVFLTGFMDDAGERIGRPVHVLQRDKNSFFLTEDFSGRMYYVYAL